MRKLDENKCRMLSSDESQSINGGVLHFLLGALVGGFIYDCISEPGDWMNGFRDGMNSAFK